MARLAGRHGVDGWVRNEGGALTLEAEGAPAAVDAFAAALLSEAPPRARIERVARRDLPALDAAGFSVVPSDPGETSLAIAPDAAICDDCLREMFDPEDRRHRYPFTSCLACGPRYTVVERLPYDRERTTYAPFAMCGPCRAEHDDPRSRRFHAQTVCCPTCGPTLELRTEQAVARGEAAIAAAAALLRRGGILTLKGMGGFHVTCLARDDAAVARLRARKRRPDKPLAVMVRDLQAAAALAWLDDDTRALLAGSDRPVVLAPGRAPVPLARAVAGDASLVGLLLPATGAQHLLLDAVGAPLVMTSANLAGRPTAWRDGEEAEREASDAILTHGLRIAARSDDAVVRRIGGAPTVLRPGRGAFPAIMKLPTALRVPSLGLGGEQKNTVCVARGDRAVVSPHLGDLGDYATYEEMIATVARLERLEGVAVRRIAHDLHPGYTATRHAIARRAEGLDLVGVQHHHAHFAACLADADHRGEAIGIVVDGTGYGLDGAIWGGEILVGDAARVRRAAHLAYVRMPGGSAAIREPWRMALAHRMAAGLSPDEGRHAPDPRAAAIAARLVETATGSPATSSAGRLFDAVAAMVGEAPPRVTFDAQAAMRLEALAATSPDDRRALPFALETGDDVLTIDPAPAIRAIDAALTRGVSPATVARRFHEGLARAFAEASVAIGAREGLGVVALSGGVAANDLFVTALSRHLAAGGLTLLRHRRLPPNDAAIAFGQICVAAARDRGHT